MANQKFNKSNIHPLSSYQKTDQSDDTFQNQNIENTMDLPHTAKVANPRNATSDHHTSRKKKKNISPERRRKMADMKASGIAVLLFFALMILIALFLLVIPRAKTSDVEKRELAKFPTFSFANWFSGDFTSGVTTFYDDTVPARDSFKNAGNNIKLLFGVKPKDQAEFIGNVAKVEEPATVSEEADTEENKAAENAAAIETTTPQVEDTINRKDYDLEVADATMEDGILIVFQDGHYRALVLTGDVDGTLYADSVNYLRQNLDKKINLYFMPVPLACEFYMPANYSEYATDQGKTFAKIAAQMDDGITFVENVETLNNHNEEPIYLRTDHHWAPLGAYYAAREFAGAAGVPFADLDTNYEKMVNEGYVGTMYAFTGSANILNDPEDFVYYIGKNNYTVDYYDENFNYSWSGDLFFDTDVSNSYLSFLGSDDIIAKISTDVKNGRKLLVVKDSYGNAQVPFYTQSFEEIYVVDQRYFKLNLANFINAQGITDVLLTHNITCLTGAEAELLESIVYGYGDVPIVDTAPKANLAEGNHANSDAAKETEEEAESQDTEE